MNRVLNWLPIFVAICISCTTTGFGADANLDWKALEDEAVLTLSRYIRIDTTNPPGNELKAAAFLKAILDKEGIDAQVVESAPGRANLYARLRGNGSKKTVVLMHHMDVVPADAKLWQEPPFSGLVKGGEIWGRGSLDNKGGGVMGLMTMLALKRQGLTLKGDVIFLGTADEEAGGMLGASYLLKSTPSFSTTSAWCLTKAAGSASTMTAVPVYIVSESPKRCRSG